MARRSVLDCSFADILFYLESIGEKSFRAEQIFDWIYKKGSFDFDHMNNVPAGLRQQLKQDLPFPHFVFLKQEEDGAGTKKLLFQLFDDQKIETVLIPFGQRLTVCVSCQAGCKFACGFCASGMGGWVRDLSCGEILAQVLEVQRRAGKRVSHVVFMGTGEPLDNWPQVKRAIEMMNSPKGLDIAARRITVSTCGVVPALKDMADLGRQIELAVSLHGYTDEIRERLMPVNKRYPLKDVVDACRQYSEKTGRQVTFEYILIDGVTCDARAPKALGKLLKGSLCKVNLIPYNPVKEFEWVSPSRNAICRFRDALIAEGIHATIRWSRGKENRGACGQLRAGE